MADSFIWWRSNHGHAAAQMVYFQWTEAMPSLRVLILPEEYCAPLTQHVSPPPLLVLLLPLSPVRYQIVRLRLLALRSVKWHIGTRELTEGGWGGTSAGARMRTGREITPQNGVAAHRVGDDDADHGRFYLGSKFGRRCLLCFTKSGGSLPNDKLGGQ